MPTSDFTAKLLELEDVFISDISTSDTEVHVFFSLKRKTHTCVFTEGTNNTIKVINKTPLDIIILKTLGIVSFYP